MTDKKITFGQLREVLQGLGFAAHEVDYNGGKVVVFRHRDGKPDIFLRRMNSRAHLESIDLLSVRNTLHYNGLVPKEKFDALFLIQKGDQLLWKEPRTGKEIEVTAAAHESDGAVIVQRNGTLSSCPIDQLRKVGLVKT
jgi:hypothetical protein